MLVSFRFLLTKFLDLTKVTTGWSFLHLPLYCNYCILIIVLRFQPLQADEAATEPDHVIKPDVPKAVKNWPQEELNVGQIAGIAVNSDLQPVIFHRADRLFDK